MARLVQIREVPEEVHRKLKSRAALRGQSLSEYLRRELEVLARAPTEEEVWSRLAQREPVNLSETPVDAIRELRERDYRD